MLVESQSMDGVVIMNDIVVAMMMVHLTIIGRYM